MSSNNEISPKESVANPVKKDCSTEENIKYVVEALELNYALDNKLEKMIFLLNERLAECRQQLKNIQNRHENKSKKSCTVSYKNLSPYFKFNLNDLPPDNNDTIMMRNLNMLNFYTCNFTRWTVKDKLDFLSTIKTASRNIKYESIISFDSTENKNDLDKSAAISKLDDYELAELALPINEDYDWHNVAKALKFRHSPQEYSAMWKLYLHPSINKEEWNRQECMKLQKLALDHKEQNWEIIAKKLNTNRSAYQCFIYYITNIKTCENKKWTAEEDQCLISLVSSFKTDKIPWYKIAPLMPERTKVQMYNRWKQCLQPNMKKGKFLPEEDSVLLTCIEKFGLDFKKISKYMNGRTVPQLKTRYNVLKKTQSAQWTPDEDKLLIQVLANQGNNIQYNKVVHLFQGKSRTNLRMRHKTLVKWMKHHPNLDLSLAPRRKPHLLKHGAPCTTIGTAIDGLNKKLTSMISTIDEDESNMGQKPSGDLVIEQIINDLMIRQVQSGQKVPRILGKGNISFSRKKELITDFWTDTDNEKAETLKTYSKKKPNVIIKKKEEKKNKLLYFPPSYPTLSASQFMLNSFAPNDESKDMVPIENMCKNNENFKKEWTVLSKVFTSLFTIPFVLREIDPEVPTEPLSE